MQNADTYLGILRERGKRGLPVERVYRQFFNRDLYLKAYGRIYRNNGAMTRGITEETVDGMSLEKIDTIIETLRHERYRWKPARRVWIPKKNGKKRPLGVTTWSDKLVAEVVRLILNAYFDVQFSDHSHGFREGRGCGDALREIYHTWKGCVWIIEGDISDCFGSLSHKLLISLLSEKIHDGRFIRLVKQLLDAGYLEDWRFNQTLSGVPQGSVVSPILSNILLNKLDHYVETVLIPPYTRGEKKRVNPIYKRLTSKAENRFKRGLTKQGQQFRKAAQQLPSKDPQDPNYRRLRFCRYADDFALGFIGPKAEAEAIKQQLASFLREELELSLSEEKTLITHARSHAAKFLGYEVTILQNDAKRSRVKRGNTKRSFDQRSINAGIGLRIPQTVILDKCARYMKNGKPIHRSELENESDFTIISTYQLEYRGIVEYYRMAYTLHTLSRLKWVMQQSLAKTLAHKHKTSVRKIYKKYQTEIEVEGKRYKVFQVMIHREGKKPLTATWGGIPLTWDMQATLEDRPGWKWSGRSELEKRLLAQVCEVCEATRLTDQIEVHHIRALKDLKTYDGREKPRWVRIMAARKRKTLVLCRTCHDDLHAGRPLKRARVSRSRTDEQSRCCWKAGCAETRLSGLGGCDTRSLL
jgi:group II intron reverse transcriptase/maturase